jgi:hypothetical protein
MAARGGARPGAGRKKGTLTKRTQEIVASAAAEGETPLEYMLRVMRTSDDSKRKDAMAIAAAPFVHPRLAAVEHSGGMTMSYEDKLTALEQDLDGHDEHAH